MPSVTAGNIISDSAQINAGVIVDSDINASAAISFSKINTTGQIVNADINASAAIADTKLGTISTAGKVTGDALTSLANVPAGAGKLPAANISGNTVKHGQTTRDNTVANSTQTIAHGLGVTPSFVRITAICTNINASSESVISHGKYNGTTTQVVYYQIRVTATASAGGSYDTTNMIYMTDAAGANKNIATITVDATNISLAWTKTGTPQGTTGISWEAVG